MAHHMLERDATLERPRTAGHDRNGNALYTNAGRLQTSALDRCRHRNALLLLHWQTLEHLTVATASQHERASLLPSRVLSLIHKLFQLYGWGGPLQSCVVRHVPQMHWLPRNTAETDGTKHGEGWCVQPYCYLWVTFPCDLRPFIHFSPNSRWSLAGRSSSSIWNTSCCIWKGQVETDALSCFSRMALLTHNFRHTALLTHNFRHTALLTHNFRHMALLTHNLSRMAMLMHNFNNMALLTHNFSHTAMLTHNVSCMADAQFQLHSSADTILAARLCWHNFHRTTMLMPNFSRMAVLTPSL